jgi:DNA ligase 1
MHAFSELAEVFQKLELTSSSSALVAILAAFLSRLNPDEAKAVAYLLRGEVAAPFESLEFGMAERMVARAMTVAYAVPAQRVDRLLAVAGDLGTAAERLADAKRGNAKTILSVFDELRKIADTSGKGSQRLKCAKLAQLLSGASAIEAKYIIRTVLASHRIGVADMTFLRALAKAYTGSVENKHFVEAAYNVLSDLGEVSRRMARSGLAGLERVIPIPGTPVRMMLASRVHDLDEVPTHMRGEMFIEYKYDGERVQIHRDGNGAVHAFSRRLERITHQYPEIIDAFAKSDAPKNTILEGEIVAFDFKTEHLLPFQTLMQRRRKHDIPAYIKKITIALFAFDLLLIKNRSLLDQPLSERRRLLQRCIKQSRRIRLSKYTESSDIAVAERYFREALADGAEGVVIKAADGPYQAGKRGWLWIKFKREYQKQLADTFDLVVVGAVRGKGDRAGSYGSLLLASFDPATNRYYSLTKVGAGFSDKMLRSLPKILEPYVIREKHRLVDTGMQADVWFEPIKVVEVAGAQLTVSPVHTVARGLIKRGGLALRFPRFVRFRDDKTAEQVTSVREIYDMYRSAMRRQRRATRRQRGVKSSSRRQSHKIRL